MPTPNIIINNVDETFFTRNAMTPDDVKLLLEKLPVPGYVNRIVLDGETTGEQKGPVKTCLLYTSPSPRDGLLSRMPSSA